MLLVALFALPLLAAVGAFLLPSTTARRALLVLAAAGHLALTILALLFCIDSRSAANHGRPAPIFDGWIGLDAPGALFLAILSVLFLAAAFYAVGYLSREEKHVHKDFQEGSEQDANVSLRNEPESIFLGCLLAFEAFMTLVTISQHLGLLWVAVEATTLASAPLIYFHRQHRSLEAAWKYLLICSVGIALALLGNFAFAAAGGFVKGETGQRHGIPLVLPLLLDHAKEFDPTWLKAAFLLFLVGYGTKMGLAPMHNWLPDAHSESPSLVSALLSGALLNCAFLGILRGHQVCQAAGGELATFSSNLLVGFGLLSMATAAIFLLNQTDYKRMLAYSSVEHMGILALGIGLGGVGVYGAGLHAINHSLTKGCLFLIAGNILAVYHTKQVKDVRGFGRILPLSAGLWVAGFLAITGTPPFGPFLSEMTILKAAMDRSLWFVAGGYLVLLVLIFLGMSRLVLPMVQGPPAPPPGQPHDSVWTVGPALVLAGVVLLLGLFVPPPLQTFLAEVGRVLGGQAGG
jgi:hydrogenase-4 component F